uniref:YadA-like family protein n=1 Tax=uncultured Psychrobacter sp. TaxID=259303 RepID=UPI00259929B2|nr:YadA-like family protein [uncultured Psychrobacter sp.]
MNRIYKVIWNEALNCFVAVGEYAKARGKSSKSSVIANARINTTATTSVKKWHVSAIGLGLLAAGVAMPASALGLYFAGDDPTPKIYTNEWLHHTVTIKGGETVAGDPSSKNINVTANKNSKTLTVKLDKTVNLGVDGSLKMGDTLVDSSGMTIKAINPINNVTLSNSGLNNGGNQITNVASGVGNNNNAANIGDLNHAIAANKTKYYSVNSTGGSNDDNLGATGENAMAMGRKASAAGSQSIAIGSVANGKPTSASGEQSIAIGANVVTTGGSAIAIGGDDLNAASETNLDGSSNIGANTGSVNTVFKTYTGRNLVEPAYYARNTEASGAASIAVGSKALSKGHLSTAVGVQSSSDGVASSAFGMGSSASKDGSVALGAGSTTLNDATYQEKLTIGNKDYNYAGATNDKGAQVSVGSEERERQIKHVASGEVSATSTDGINGSQLHATNESVKDLSGVVVANKTHFYSVNSTDSTRGNYNNDGATGVNAMAAGIDALATGENATALGTKSNAEGTRSTAIGYQAQAKDRNAIALGYQANAHQKHSTAIGYAANAGYAAIAIGDAATATKKGSTAIGSQSVSTDVYSTALGREAKALEKNTVAVGYSTTASGESSVAIGDGAKASGVNSIAIGTGNIVNGDNSGAFGDPNNISGSGSYAVGNNNTIDADNSFVLGNNVTINASDKYSIALGEGTVINGEDSIAIGRGATAAASTRNGLAIGVRSSSGNHAASLGDDATSGNYAVALGSKSTAQIGGTAIGQASSAVSNATALGRAAIAGQSGNVALGHQSVTAAQHTGAFAINNQPVAGLTSGAKTVSVGSVGAERQIQNVAPGVVDATSTDAINGSQLFATNEAIDDLSGTVIANKTKYYSVNSKGGSNDDNLGATGQNAMAMGRNASATGSQTIAIGSGASGQHTTASGEQSIAIGANVVSSGNSSIAIGGDDLDAASADAGAMFTAYTGSSLVETPPYMVNTESDGAASIAIGAKALSEGALSTAVGVRSSSAGDASSAFGMGSSAVAEGSVALGAGSVANVAGGAMGYDPTGSSDTAIKATQSGTRYGAVSVGNGAEGGNRQIVNVAAGTNDSDAVNVAQLKGLSGVVNQGLKFDGDTGTPVTRQMGDTLTVKGGATNLSDNNIGVVANGSDTLSIKLAKNIDLGKTGSVTMGSRSPLGLGPVTTVDRLGVRTGSIVGSTAVTGLGVLVNGPLGIPSTALNMDGLTIIGGPSVTRSGGVNAGNRKIVNVDDGSNDKDAVNFGQLADFSAAARTKVIKGTNVDSVDFSIDSDTGQDVYTVNANGSSVSSGDDTALTVTAGDKGDDNITDYKVDLSDASKASLTKADSAMQTVITQIDGNDVKTLDQNDNTANFVTGSNIELLEDNGGIKIATADEVSFVSVTTGDTLLDNGGVTLTGGSNQTVTLSNSGLNNGGNRVTNVDDGEEDMDAVNVRQLNATNSTVNLGLHFTGDDTNVIVNRKLGETLTIRGGATDLTNNNIGVVADEDGNLNVKLNEDVRLGKTGSVRMESTVLNNAGVTITDGPNQTITLSNEGLDNGNNRIIKVAKGIAPSDAVNFAQLTMTNDEIAKGIKIGDGNVANDQQFALGETINVTGDGNITTLASAAGVQVRLSNQLNLGDEGSMQVGSSLMTNNSFTFVSDNAPNRIVRLTNNGLDNGFNRITNVAAGIDFTDAATVGQLEAATFALDQGWALTAQGDIATMVKQGSAVDINSRDGNITISRTTASNGISPLASRAADVNDISFELNRNIAIDSVQAGDSTLSNDGLTIIGGPSMTKAGINAADTKITNVMSGEVSASSSDAINGSQLYAQGAGISTLIGGDTVYNPEDGTFTNANIGGTGQSSIDGAIASIKQGETIINESIATNTTNIEANTADIATNTTNISTNRTNIQGNTDRLDTGLNFGADSGNNINKPIGDDSVLSFTGGNNITTTAQGSSILFDLNGNISVDSVSTGNTTINSGGVTITDGPSMTADGLYAGGKSITGVADGVEATDAVNLGQLSALDSRLNNSMSDLGYKIGEVEDDANAGISAAMAMSSLPQAYISGKSLISGGVGTYNGESAVAIGFSKLSNDGRWVMKINGTADTQGNAGGSIGAGFHFD